MIRKSRWEFIQCKSWIQDILTEVVCVHIYVTQAYLDPIRLVFPLTILGLCGKHSVEVGWGTEGAFQQCFCEKLPEASPISSRANAKWLQDRCVTGQNWVHQWERYCLWDNIFKKGEKLLSRMKMQPEKKEVSICDKKWLWSVNSITGQVCFLHDYNFWAISLSLPQHTDLLLYFLYPAQLSREVLEELWWVPAILSGPAYLTGMNSSLVYSTVEHKIMES